jgi:hypothetical protein
MEISKPEVAALEKVVVESRRSRFGRVCKLSLVGGGMGDVVFV